MLQIANNSCEEALQQITRAICNRKRGRRTYGQPDRWAEGCFLSRVVWSELCCLVGSSATVKAWPGHTGAGWGQRGASKGAQDYTDASPTTMSHFRPLWFGLRGWPPASWSCLSSSFACSLYFLFWSTLSLSSLISLHVLPVRLFSLYILLTLFPSKSWQ